MPSATLELAKYLQRENLPVVGDPYIEFRDVPNGPISYEGSMASIVPLFGPVTLYRFSNERYLVQWFQLGIDSQPSRVNKIISLLDRVVEENRASQIS